MYSLAVHLGEMHLARILRVGTVVLMASTLLAGFIWPDLFPLLRKILVWLIPLWIALLFLAQTVATPSPEGVTPLQVWWDRLKGRSWTCKGCGRRYPLDVPLCSECAELRPEPVASGPQSWVCAVCGAENGAEASACLRCTMPRLGEEG